VNAKTEPAAATVVGAYPVLRTWAEDGATWNDALAGVPWEIGGCDGGSDRGQTAVAASTLEWTKRWQAWEGQELSALVQNWVANPQANHGLVLLATPGGARQEWTLASSQSVIDWDKRPRLTVTFYLEPE